MTHFFKKYACLQFNVKELKNAFSRREAREIL